MSTTTTTMSTKTPKPEPCKFCQRPTKCPNCETALGLQPTPPTDIDGDVPDIHNQLPSPKTTTTPHTSFSVAFPPTAPTYTAPFSVFAAGSIEMGRAIKWQSLLANHLQHLPLTLLNPRRGHWNPAITPQAKDAAFREQVEWELDALTNATVIAFFFDHATMSPVTMCELGLWAHSGKIVVCCDRRFWKAGNVHLVCEKYGVPLVERFEEMVGCVEAMLRVKGLEEGVGMGVAEAERVLRERVPVRKGREFDAVATGHARE